MTEALIIIKVTICTCKQNDSLMRNIFDLSDESASKNHDSLIKYDLLKHNMIYSVTREFVFDKKISRY